MQASMTSTAPFIAGLSLPSHLYTLDSVIKSAQGTADADADLFYEKIKPRPTAEPLPLAEEARRQRIAQLRRTMFREARLIGLLRLAGRALKVNPPVFMGGGEAKVRLFSAARCPGERARCAHLAYTYLKGRERASIEGTSRLSAGPEKRAHIFRECATKLGLKPETPATEAFRAWFFAS